MRTIKAVRGAAAVAAGAAVLGLAAPTAALAADASGRADPSVVAPGGNARFSVACGSSSATSAQLFGTTLGLPARIPMRAGATSGTFYYDLVIPRATSPGTYSLSEDCSDGSATTATITVSPNGGAGTGDGSTAGGPSSMIIAGGIGMVAVAGIGGFFLLRRRRAAVSGS